ncbi:hypothetical protein EYR36_003242 [Pleurotus pulmonarius]|nr:hypothetical protein EYR36_003242 [Pleurotus pulmonarius]
MFIETPSIGSIDPIITVAISTPIQIFVAWRISIISRSWLMPALICVLGIISLAGGIWTCITVATIRVFSRKPELHWPALTWLLASAIADALITSTLVYSLVPQYKRKTGFKDTDSVIERVIRFTIQTGMITWVGLSDFLYQANNPQISAVFAILDVVFFLVFPHTTLNFIWDLALGKLYSNVLMSTMNSRAGWDRIANPHTNHNVLFGDETSTSFMITNTRFQFRDSRKSVNEIPPQPFTTSVFEPEADLSHVVGKINAQHDIFDLPVKRDDSEFGPMLIGVLFNTVLYGILVVQRCVMATVFSETVNSALDIVMVYEPLILNFGRATTFFPIMLATDPIITVLISTPIQIFVAWRILIISRAKWLAGLICIFAFISMGGGFWTGITVTIIRRFDRKPELHWPALTWLLASAIADVTITVSLAFSLSRRKTGISNTDDAVNRIIRLTIQTGLVTAIFAALDVIFFLALPRTTMHVHLVFTVNHFADILGSNFIWDFALSKLYTNALLSTLNARVGWNKAANANTQHNVLFGNETGLTRGTSREVRTIAVSHHLSFTKRPCSSGEKSCVKPISHRESVGSLNHVSLMIHALILINICVPSHLSGG